MAATTGSGGLSGAGGWGALGMQGAGMAESAVQATRQAAAQTGPQPGSPSGSPSAQAGALPSAAELAQTARMALAQAQAQQADVMLTLSKGAQSLLAGSALLGQAGAGTGGTSTTNGGAAQNAAQSTAQNGLHTAAPDLAENAPQLTAQTLTQSAAQATGSGVSTLVADVLRAADAVLNDPLATPEQKAMATGLMQLANTMAGQSASGGGATGAGVVSLPLLQLLNAQSSGPQSAASGALGGAVVTTSGLYGLASNTAQEGARAMATALLGMGTTQEDEIVLPGGIVQFAANAAQAAGSTGQSTPATLLGNALTTALLPQLFKALTVILADQNATAEQKAAATTLLEMFDATEDTGQIPQALLNPLLAAALMPALNPSQRGRLVRAALAGEVEDMGRLEEAEQSGQGGVGGLRAALRRNAAYMASVQKPLLNLALQVGQKLDAEGVEAALAGWATAGHTAEQDMEDALGGSSILAFSQNLMADSPYMATLASTSLTPILIMSWAALLSGCLPRAVPFVPRVWRRANKKKWRRKNRQNKMNFQNLMFTNGVAEA
ncbi:MAG: hypothetical protein ABF636_08430 [Acetobacter sp.]